MFMSKRGISPLIATVLIIGFTIALAAIIITWGFSYVTGSTRETGEQAEKTLRVVKDGGFNLLSGTTDNTNIYLRVENSGKLRISGYFLQIFIPNGDVISLESVDYPGLGPFEIDLVVVTRAVPVDTEVKFIPVFELNGENIPANFLGKSVVLTGVSGGSCGDGVINGNEVCDGGALGGQTCQSLGFAGGGNLACNSDCLSFDTTQCTAGGTCPDGTCGPGENCPGGPGIGDDDACTQPPSCRELPGQCTSGCVYPPMAFGQIDPGFCEGNTGCVGGNCICNGNGLCISPTECSDGNDNDGDGFIDWNGGPGGEPADAGCVDAMDDDELTECQDGINNDNDAFTDFPSDLGCVDVQDTSEWESLTSCVDLDRVDETYEVVQNIDGADVSLACFDIQANGITLVGNKNNYAVTGNSNAGEGIYSVGHSDITIRDIELVDFSHGVRLNGVTDSFVMNSNLIRSHNRGLHVSNGNGIVISGNTIEDNLGSGIWFSGTDNSEVSGNTICNNIPKDLECASQGTGNSVGSSGNILDNTDCDWAAMRTDCPP